MARALAFSPLAGRGAWVPCGGMSPSWEGAWWRSTLLTKDVSGSVEKVMVRLPSRCTLIKSQWVLVTPAGSFHVVWPCDRMKVGALFEERVQHLAPGLALQAGVTPQARRRARGVLLRLGFREQRNRKPG